MNTIQTVKASLRATFDSILVDEVIEAFVESKQHFYMGGLRLSEVEGGRFCEAAFRMLEQKLAGKYTSLGSSIDTDKISRALSNATKGSLPESLRLHIPRALRVVYDIRNNRDAAHLGDGIDPNLQDASLVTGILDWTLAEFVRLYHRVSASEAQQLINEIVERRAPAVQEFGDFLKVLRPGLDAGDWVLLLLYQRSNRGAEFTELSDWILPRMRKNLRRTINRLVDKSLVHGVDDFFHITMSGSRLVEAKRFHELDA